MKILVVYFSRTGRTRQIAEAIAGALGADIECIAEAGDRSGIWGYLRSAREAMKQRVIGIATPARNPADYDLIILGTPVWGHNMCSPLRSYITAHKDRLAALAVFCTQGGSGGPKVIGDVAMLCGRTPVATLVLEQREIEQDRFTAKLDRFIKAVAAAGRTPT